MKKPTPKKRQPKCQSQRRYKTFAGNVRKRLVNSTKLGPCPKCKEMRVIHKACPICGHYNGRSVVDKEKEMQKVTKVKA
jgi:large subunit ribosomal protein L32